MTTRWIMFKLLQAVRQEFEFRFSKKYELARKEAKFFASTGLNRSQREILRIRERQCEEMFLGTKSKRNIRRVRSSRQKREIGFDDLGYAACEEISGVSTINRIVDFFI